MRIKPARMYMGSSGEKGTITYTNGEFFSPNLAPGVYSVIGFFSGSKFFALERGLRENTFTVEAGRVTYAGSYKLELTKGGPLIRTRSADLAAAGVERMPRVVGARDGLPLLEDGRTVDVANIVWCSGFTPGLSWIDLPVLDTEGVPIHDAGVVTSEPGLYFVGQLFLYSFSSTMVHGVGRDADRIAGVIDSRVRAYSMSRAPDAGDRAEAMA
jgi:hypothetical protein